ncbi:hypothetical protein CCHL11_00599 [Colletotrichum chlorophyti]|uniref:2EXR domain-containing protein n=1 Tax=Colletotrichum chlorophyti TaxID=708187 RepID=A0A1Q8S4N4_9PEZI|nr:hypothetical protein CCHL11_00599 [Colletotrichum chlorophyti]
MALDEHRELDEVVPNRPHLELFNPDSLHYSHGSFSLFPELPFEIRLLIWHHALQRHRLLHLVIKERREGTDETNVLLHLPFSNFQNCHISGKHYQIIFQAQSPFLPVLMSVNKESRQTTLAFYSTQVPCYLRDGNSIETILRLNMDWDYLKITTYPPSSRTLINVLYDLRTRDPRHRGPRHIVLDEDTHDEFRETAAVNPKDPNSPPLTAVQAMLRNLKTIWFQSTTRDGRGLTMMTHRSAHIFNYGMPLFPTFTFFEPPVPDLRNISRNLGNVAADRDPRRMVVMWRRVLRIFGMQPEDIELNPAVEVRIMIASAPGHQVRSRKDAGRWLQHEDFWWLELQWWYRGWDRPVGVGDTQHGSPGCSGLAAGCFATSSGLQPGLPVFDGPEVLAVAPRPALGFWLFPVGAFGKVHEDQPPHTWLKGQRLWDMSPFWPDLVLANVGQ